MSRIIGLAHNPFRGLNQSRFSVDSTAAMTQATTAADERRSLRLERYRFEAIVEVMKARYDVRVKRWRRQMSGCAWSVFLQNGRRINWIECPLPRTPISLAIFLHEIGHHAIGFDRYKKRCEEEYHAWVWAIAQMRRLGIEPDEKVNRRFELSIQYAVDKALRRGIKRLPEPLMKFARLAA